MKFQTNEATLFFLQRPESLPLWEGHLAPWLEEHFPEAELNVQKTQITLRSRISFLALSLPPRRCDPQRQGVLRLSFGLDRLLEWDRIDAVTQISARRFTYHTLVRSREDLDEALLTLLREAWEMAS